MILKEKKTSKGLERKNTSVELKVLHLYLPSPTPKKYKMQNTKKCFKKIVPQTISPNNSSPHKLNPRISNTKNYTTPFVYQLYSAYTLFLYPFVFNIYIHVKYSR